MRGAKSRVGKVNAAAVVVASAQLRAQKEPDLRRRLTDWLGDFWCFDSPKTNWHIRRAASAPRPSNAPFTLLPEFVHHTTPSSSVAPFVMFFKAAYKNDAYEFQSYHFYPGSPTRNLISPSSVCSGTSSPSRDAEFHSSGAALLFPASEPPTILSAEDIIERKLTLQYAKDWRSLLDDHISVALPLVDLNSSSMSNGSVAVANQRGSSELNAEEFEFYLGKKATLLGEEISEFPVSRNSAVGRTNKSDVLRVIGLDETYHDLPRIIQQHVSIPSTKEFKFDISNGASSETSFGSEWWVNGGSLLDGQISVVVPLVGLDNSFESNENVAAANQRGLFELNAQEFAFYLGKKATLLGEGISEFPVSRNSAIRHTNKSDVLHVIDIDETYHDLLRIIQQPVSIPSAEEFKFDISNGASIEISFGSEWWVNGGSLLDGQISVVVPLVGLDNSFESNENVVAANQRGSFELNAEEFKFYLGKKATLLGEGILEFPISRNSAIRHTNKSDVLLVIGIDETYHDLPRISQQHVSITSAEEFKFDISNGASSETSFGSEWWVNGGSLFDGQISVVVPLVGLDNSFESNDNVVAANQRGLFELNAEEFAFYLGKKATLLGEGISEFPVSRNSAIRHTNKSDVLHVVDIDETYHDLPRIIQQPVSIPSAEEFKFDISNGASSEISFGSEWWVNGGSLLDGQISVVVPLLVLDNSFESNGNVAAANQRGSFELNVEEFEFYLSKKATLLGEGILEFPVSRNSAIWHNNKSDVLRVIGIDETYHDLPRIRQQPVSIPSAEEFKFDISNGASSETSFGSEWWVNGGSLLDGQISVVVPLVGLDNSFESNENVAAANRRGLFELNAEEFAFYLGKKETLLGEGISEFPVSRNSAIRHTNKSDVLHVIDIDETYHDLLRIIQQPVSIPSAEEFKFDISNGASIEISFGSEWWVNGGSLLDGQISVVVPLVGLDNSFESNGNVVAANQRGSFELNAEEFEFYLGKKATLLGEGILEFPISRNSAIRHTNKSDVLRVIGIDETYHDLPRISQQPVSITSAEEFKFDISNGASSETSFGSEWWVNGGSLFDGQISVVVPLVGLDNSFESNENVAAANQRGLFELNVEEFAFYLGKKATLLGEGISEFPVSRNSAIRHTNKSDVLHVVDIDETYHDLPRIIQQPVTIPSAEEFKFDISNGASSETSFGSEWWVNGGSLFDGQISVVVPLVGLDNSFESNENVAAANQRGLFELNAEEFAFYLGKKATLLGEGISEFPISRNSAIRHTNKSDLLHVVDIDETYHDLPRIIQQHVSIPSAEEFKFDISNGASSEISFGSEWWVNGGSLLDGQISVVVPLVGLDNSFESNGNVAAANQRGSFELNAEEFEFYLSKKATLLGEGILEFPVSRNSAIRHTNKSDVLRVIGIDETYHDLPRISQQPVSIPSAEEFKFDISNGASSETSFGSEWWVNGGSLFDGQISVVVPLVGLDNSFESNENVAAANQRGSFELNAEEFAFYLGKKATLLGEGISEFPIFRNSAIRHTNKSDVLHVIDIDETYHDLPQIIQQNVSIPSSEEFKFDITNGASSETSFGSEWWVNGGSLLDGQISVVVPLVGLDNSFESNGNVAATNQRGSFELNAEEFEFYLGKKATLLGEGILEFPIFRNSAIRHTNKSNVLRVIGIDETYHDLPRIIQQLVSIPSTEEFKFDISNGASSDTSFGSEWWVNGGSLLDGQISVVVPLVGLDNSFESNENVAVANQRGSFELNAEEFAFYLGKKATLLGEGISEFPIFRNSAIRHTNKSDVLRVIGIDENYHDLPRIIKQSVSIPSAEEFKFNISNGVSSETSFGFEWWVNGGSLLDGQISVIVPLVGLDNSSESNGNVTAANQRGSFELNAEEFAFYLGKKATPLGEEISEFLVSRNSAIRHTNKSNVLRVIDIDETYHDLPRIIWQLVSIPSAKEFKFDISDGASGQTSFWF